MKRAGGAPLLFEGDLTGDHHAGDEVIITPQVIEIEVNGYMNEFFKEAWDGQYMKPIPESSIRHTE